MKLSFEIINGEYVLAGGGTILIFSNKPTVITIIDDGAPMYIELTFETNQSVDGIRRDINLKKEKNGFVMNFINYNSPAGHFTSEPLKIGHAFGKELFMAYDIVTPNVDHELKLMHYSMYFRKEVSNG